MFQMPFLGAADQLLATIETESVWEAALDAEPEPHQKLAGTRLDDLAHAFTDFVDLKSPYVLGHSSAVGRLAEAAAQALRLSRDEVAACRRAGLLHDLGGVSVPNSIWDKAGRLTAAEWERVRLHPYYTERLLTQSPVLRPLAYLAGSHHERRHGSGYHRGLVGGALSTGARILAAADAYQAMTAMGTALLAPVAGSSTPNSPPRRRAMVSEARKTLRRRVVGAGLAEVRGPKARRRCARLGGNQCGTYHWRNRIVQMLTRPDRAALVAFRALVILVAANLVAIRFSNRELAPFWGAGTRFALPAILFAAVMLVRRIAVPRGAALVGAVLFGFLDIAAFFALTYWGLVRVSAGQAAVIGALLPIATLFLAVAHGLERLAWRTVVGAAGAVVLLLLSLVAG